MNNLRDDVERLPLRMASLKIDDNGMPIIWAQGDGTTIDAAMNSECIKTATQRKLCCICGEKLGVYACFLGGIMVGLTRSSNEPPAHRECARWMACNTPLLIQQPAVLLWITDKYEVLLDDKQQIVFSLGEPTATEFYTDKRKSTRDEVLAAVQGGLPGVLELISKTDVGDLTPEDVLEKMLVRYIEVFPET